VSSESFSQRFAPVRIVLLQTLQYAAMGLAGPFTVIYYKHVLAEPGGPPAVGLIGLLIFVNMIVGVVSLPVAGFLVDRFKIENRLLTVLSALVAIGMIPVAVAGAPAAANWPLATRWLALVIGVGISGLFIRPMFPIIDTETLSYLHVKYGSGDRYGRYRMWGTVGWVVTATGMGVILTGRDNLAGAFVAGAAGYLVLAAVAATGFRAQIQQVTLPWEHLKHDRVFARYLVFAFVFYLASSSSFSFTGYLLDDLHMGAAGIGIAFGIGAVWEIPIMRGSDRILARIGCKRMILLGAGVTALKLVLFVVVGSRSRPVLMAVVHQLTGVGYPLVWLGAIGLMDLRAHPDLRATYQSLNQLVATIAMALAGPFGSLVVASVGSRWLMGVDAFLLVAGIVYLAAAVPEPRPQLLRAVAARE
jgi:MFS transporter, PPP family, 3-phenylpropionic acid transporter